MSPLTNFHCRVCSVSRGRQDRRTPRLRGRLCRVNGRDWENLLMELVMGLVDSGGLLSREHRLNTNP